MKFEPVPFDDAIISARSRDVMLPEHYYGQQQGVARAESFSVAGLSRLDQVQAVLDSLAQTMEVGETFAAWQDRVRRGEVPLDLPDYRLDNIYRTNVQGAYARGRCLQHDLVADAQPWLLYSAVNDSRTRPAHAAMNGTLLHRDDPWWQTHRPPNGYRCRCTVIALTDKRAKAMGGPKAPRVDARTGVEPEPDSGWDYDICGNSRAGTERALSAAAGTSSPELAAELRDLQDKATSFDPATWRAVLEDIYEAPDGTQHTVKFADDVTKELAAAKLNARIGVQTLNPDIVNVDGRFGLSTIRDESLKDINIEDAIANHAEDLALVYAANRIINGNDLVDFSNLRLSVAGRLVVVDFANDAVAATTFHPSSIAAELERVAVKLRRIERTDIERELLLSGFSSADARAVSAEMNARKLDLIRQHLKDED